MPFFCLFRLEQTGQVIVSYCTFEILTCPTFQTSFLLHDQQIIYRAYHPKTPQQIARYKQKLQENFIEPTVFELMVMNADGTNKRQITNFGAASFAPFFAPDGNRVIFASNLENPKGRNFDLYLVNLDGTNLKRITYGEQFDGFPMFSPDGKKLVFASNRNAARGDTNVFIADWIE